MMGYHSTEMTMKSERKSAVKKVKDVYKEFDFTTGMLKGALSEGQKKK